MPKPSPPPPKTRLQNPLTTLFLITVLCSTFYTLSSYRSTITPPPKPKPKPKPTTKTHFNSSNPITNLTSLTHQTTPPPPIFKTHHKNHTFNPLQQYPPKKFQSCPSNFTHYCPCQDPLRERFFKITKMLHRERHCPTGESEILRCLVPVPVGYKKPFVWPKSRSEAWFSNVPFKVLTESKKRQNWVRLVGDRLVFPGGGTSFQKGVKGYVDMLKKMVSLESGVIRTVVDTGCGVASFGDALMDYNIITMSIAPRDIHEAQVQFALERGLPAMLGVLGTYRLPYPSRSFDMAHCSRCLVPWTEYDGLYLMEIDRILRPGGYWVLSGPPINWRNKYTASDGTTIDPKKELARLEDLARRLCWRKLKGKGPIAVWQKPNNHIECNKRNSKFHKFCDKNDDPDDGWYRTMDACISRLPHVDHMQDVSGGVLENWPKRLNTVPPRIGLIPGLTSQDFVDDNLMWQKRVSTYAGVLKSLSNGGYRNVMDMNAGLGGFAASLSKYPVWVMNVVPHDAEYNTLGVIYERGLIGTYMNWCEPFSTYPRSYDLIHADNVFSLYMNKCDIVDIFIEMYRIIRPKGTIIIADHVDIIVKIKSHTDQMSWHARLLDTEAGPFGPRKLLFLDI
ncbi:putative S-adenosyl-L-methionine-dependent methyltransferase [Helianthus annuus]|nr:putative S-adenosyl-L-methionine-dependent methyltransferase [Helianthus annuus]